GSDRGGDRELPGARVSPRPRRSLRTGLPVLRGRSHHAAGALRGPEGALSAPGAMPLAVAISTAMPVLLSAFPHQGPLQALPVAATQWIWAIVAMAGLTLAIFLAIALARVQRRALFSSSPAIVPAPPGIAEGGFPRVPPLWGRSPPPAGPRARSKSSRDPPASRRSRSSAACAWSRRSSRKRATPSS